MLENAKRELKLETAKRLKKLRKENKFSQGDLKDKLSLVINPMYESKSSIALSTISSWELGNKMPSTLFLSALAEVYNVSIDYIIGRTNFRRPEDDMEKIVLDDYIAQIKKEKLAEYDGLPVVISYQSSSMPEEWGIYDAKRKVFYCKGKTVEVSDNDIYFATTQGSCPTLKDTHKSLTLEQCKKLDTVWISYSSVNADVCNRMSGWFKTNKEMRYFQNIYGVTLPFTGLGISFKAYKEKPYYI